MRDEDRKPPPRQPIVWSKRTEFQKREAEASYQCWQMWEADPRVSDTVVVLRGEGLSWQQTRARLHGQRRSDARRVVATLRSLSLVAD